MFLTFEGADGAGKTTQVARLQSALEERGYAVVRTREPGGDTIGEKVRELVLHASVSPAAELLLFAAARAQNVSDVIRPALEIGKIVLCDRFVDSTVAYQGYGRGLPLEIIAAVNQFATGGLLPTRTFLLDLPPAEGLARRKSGGDTNYLDHETLSFHERVQAGFAACAAADPDRFILVDASASADAVAETLLTHALRLLTE